MNATEHLLVCLVEECSEIAKELSKVLRFGPEDLNPHEPNGPINRERLIHELNDLLGVVSLLVDFGIIRSDWMNTDKVLAKKRKVRQFMGYAVKAGVLSDDQRQGATTFGG